MDTSSTISNSQLSKKLKACLHGCSLDDFTKHLREIHLSKTSPAEVVKEALSLLSLILYQNNYSHHVSCAFMTLIGAFQAGKFLEGKEQWLPVIQALWYAGQEDKSPAFNLPSPPAPQGKLDAQGLMAAVQIRNFDRAFEMVRLSLADKKDFLSVRDTLFSLAFKDIANLGNKFVHLMKCFEFLEMVPDGDRERILFPALHHLVLAPSDTEYFQLLKTKLGRLGVDVTQFLNNRGTLSDEEANRLERILVYQFPGLIIENLVYELKEGLSIDELFQVTLTAASQALLGAFRESWIFPIQGYHFAHEAWECFRRISSDLDKIYLVFMAALFVNKMAVESMDAHKVVKFEEADLSGWEISESGLEKAIADSKPQLAGAISLQLLEKKDFPKLSETLLRAAVKNDSGVCRGQDLPFCSHVLTDYPNMRIPHRTKLITALSYFLADIEKDYDLYHAVQSL